MPSDGGEIPALAKQAALARLLAGYGSLLVAFSGGVDSAFLLAMARKVLGDRVTAVTAEAVIFPKREREDAILLAHTLGARHLMVSLDVAGLPEFIANTPRRCYFCKKSLSEKLLHIARESGIEAVAFGANTDDLTDYRPGTEAARERGIRSPLVDAGLSKEEIRFLAREMGLAVWDKPAMACLASRIPYGNAVTPEKLAAVEAAEESLFALGMKQVRVRHHDTVARIETGEEDFPSLLDPAIRKNIVERFKALGFTYIALDLEGYVSGSMNRIL